MLTLSGISYRYAGASSQAVRGLDLELANGQVIGLAGASESGKSTVCLIAGGLAPRTIRGTLRGTLLLDGLDVNAAPMHVLAASIGICFQDPAAQLSGVCASVFEEVAFTPMNLGVPRDEVIERTYGALASMGIEALAARDPARLSGGQMQLVAIAGLLAMRPRHLVLDEPTAQLDPAGTALVGAAIAKLSSDGASILIAEQKTDLLARVCSRVLVLDAGRIVLDGQPEDVLGDRRLADLGVPAPSAIRLRRALDAAGLTVSIPPELVA